MKYRLCVVSDVHYDIDRFRQILPIINSSDYFVFCGDGLFNVMTVRGEILVPTVCVRGNCDYEPRVCDMAELADLKIGETRAIVTHGHRQNAKYGVSGLVAAAKSNGSSLVFFGHTHSFCDRIEDGVHLINPGALCSGSYAMVCLDGENIMCEQRFV